MRSRRDAPPSSLRSISEELPMKSISMHRQHGQAIGEFIAAMTLFVPLALSVIYIGKYADIKHEAIQASRFAAFERALDPSSAHENATVLTEETRARFFTDGSRNSGRIGYQDSTASLKTAGTLNPLWSQVNNTPLLSRYSDVSVSVTQSQVASAFFARIQDATSLMFKLNGNGQVQANVEVPVANVAHFAPLANINLKIGATTVIAGDSWNAGGTADAANHFTILSVPDRLFSSNPQPGSGWFSKVLGWLSKFGGWLYRSFFQMLSGTDGPQLGCVRPDVVPTYAAPDARYHPTDACY
jgi:hypothetical protein